MLKRDLIEDEIEKMGKALRRLAGDFIKLKNDGDFSEADKTFKDQLTAQLGLDVDLMAQMNREELQDYIAQKRLVADHLEIISDYFGQLGEHDKAEGNPSSAKAHLEKAVLLLDLADETSNVLSFERINKKGHWQNLLG